MKQFLRFLVAFTSVTVAVWLVMAVIALIDFGGFTGKQMFFVATFFGCIAIFGFLGAGFITIKQRLDRIENRIENGERR